jgi:hypothetical protein
MWSRCLVPISAEAIARVTEVIWHFVQYVQENAGI